MIRLKDIAARAGVSVMTVSRVLRDTPDISSATKARVSQLARQMGYVPDRMAQGLRTRKSDLFGLVISTTTNPIFSRLVMSLEERAHELGYQLILAHSFDDPVREEQILRRFLARRVDGIFIAPAYRLDPSASVYAELKDRAVPTVLLGHPARFCEGFPSVVADDAGGARALTQHLLGLGHRRIAFLTGPPAAPWARERLEGYRQAMRESGAAQEDALIFQAGASIESGAAAAAQMLAEAAAPSAIQAVNDLVAIGASNRLLQEGWRIPADISVGGFGNIMASEYFRVPLTTIRQPQARSGLAAMETMLALLRGGAPTSHRLPAEFVLRASTGAPPSSARAPG